MVFCQHCGHLYNAAFDARLIDYTLEYENSLHYSQQFQAYVEDLADDLIQRYGLRGKTIVEIACGKGDFLALICRLGQNAGYGFDPSFEPGRQTEHTADNITILQEYYSKKHTAIDADLICCRHALEHIEQPQTLLRTLYEALPQQRTSALYFEVPNVLYTLKEMGIWDLIYEHCGYFSEVSLAHLFRHNGFSVERLYEGFGGQYLSIEAMLDTNHQNSAVPGLDLATLSDYAVAFEHKYHEKLALWKQRLTDFKQQGRQVAVWGAGSKGVTFLNVLQAADTIAQIVDVNIHKQGKYIAGTGHQVVGPEQLTGDPPDTVVVMNPIYLQEIDRALKALDLETTVIAA